MAEFYQLLSDCWSAFFQLTCFNVGPCSTEYADKINALVFVKPCIFGRNKGIFYIFGKCFNADGYTFVAAARSRNKRAVRIINKHTPVRIKNLVRRKLLPFIDFEESGKKYDNCRDSKFPQCTRTNFGALFLAAILCTFGRIISTWFYPVDYFFHKNTFYCLHAFDSLHLARLIRGKSRSILGEMRIDAFRYSLPCG